MKSNYFGSDDYSKEELVAEIGAAFLCAMTGIERTTIKNNAAYIRGWRKLWTLQQRLSRPAEA
jgi:antirestriction protein ArdC